MKHLNLSFAAAGFLGIYHLGAASAFLKHGQNMLNSVKVFAGASAGSLVATVLLTAPHKIQESKDFLYTFSEDFRRRIPGVVKPRYDFMKNLREGIETILPAQAHEIAENRLYVSITKSKSLENCLVSSFASREELIKIPMQCEISNNVNVYGSSVNCASPTFSECLRWEGRHGLSTGIPAV
ncbi:patatin-like phospholipase domain-containing protein 4 isoform X4 [Dendropsophus ebraccatus]|uniref:patatin-like phospholipase domain-containing protein 4 isoform X4 n=1 Tax=Dendropsophus ebraccatus TaxID=150705 RepID=UPI00383198CF